MSWTEVNKPWRAFRDDELCAPGVIVEWSNGDQELIGDMNALGGYCDDCNCGYDSIVKRVLDLRSQLQVAKGARGPEATASSIVYGSVADSAGIDVPKKA